MTLAPVPANAQMDPCRVRHDLVALQADLAEPIETYRSRHGELPRSLEDLARAKLITRIPVDPAGRPYVLEIAPGGSWRVTTLTRDEPSFWACLWTQRPRPLWPSIVAIGTAVVAAIAFVLTRRRLLLAVAIAAAALALYAWEYIGPVS